ncbi:hypothetical protein EV688_1258 [Chromatocurvus halotolerans]|uniref:Uncharacterized protein n=1 Tax=Chromatocurvus halotolerans TaxID=1132028 RepID=A0A4R2KER1_9GAMM|nr:hypothetical protein EV688_1258 [Chromatocurvus halotolerans]
MQALRTPDARFESLSGYGFDPQYLQVGDQEGADCVCTISMRAGASVSVHL